MIVKNQLHLEEVLNEKFRAFNFNVDFSKYIVYNIGEKTGEDSLVNFKKRTIKDFYRPAEVDLLLGDSTKAREELGWHPKTNFIQLVKKMVDYDVASASVYP